AAVAEVATLALTVQETAEAKKAADAAAAQAAADAAAAAEAAAQAAAEQAAQRVAWKKSLLGYANGKIPDSALCEVSFDSSVRLRCDAAEQLDVLNAAYKAHFGTDMKVSDSYRSYAGQVMCKRTKGYLCATPGTSNHGSGVAIDFGGGIESFGTRQFKWMQSHAPDLSWTHPSWAQRGGSKPEAWHWEYTG
ncbi:M15 family metallopeptidase, partial [uncultured Cellulomonas sp.]|uniref:M15 family metallopeptidase n=1 Tax=uncultured Cellulomonas sp. TaxID=189682 RepID=UPI0028E81616